MSAAGTHPEQHGAVDVLSREDRTSFDRIAKLAHEMAGLVLTADKASMVLARIGKNIKRLNLPNLKSYCDVVTDPSNTAERKHLILSLTTNVTSFMREQHHFDTLATVAVPEMIAQLKQGQPVRLWSAGCSSGQEPYSIAIQILKAIPSAHEMDIKILATDIDTKVLDIAKSGTYTQREMNGLAREDLDRFFERQDCDRDGTKYRAKKDLRSLIKFNELNLMERWPIKKRFNAVFCRNVVIYFDRTTQQRLWSRFESTLVEGGFLFIGHSERLDTSEFPQFEAVGTTTYRLKTLQQVSA